MENFISEVPQTALQLYLIFSLTNLVHKLKEELSKWQKIIEVIQEEENKIHQVEVTETNNENFSCIAMWALAESDRRKEMGLHKSRSMRFICTFSN